MTHKFNQRDPIDSHFDHMRIAPIAVQRRTQGIQRGFRRSTENAALRRIERDREWSREVGHRYGDYTHTVPLHVRS